MKTLKSILVATALGATLSAPAFALENGAFSLGLLNWNPLGDVSINSGGAFLTTASLTFEDDFPAAAGAFNASGTAAAEVGTGSTPVETFVGLSLGALDPAPLNGVNAYEGSALKQSFAVAAGDTLTFDYTFFTHETVGEDYACVIIDGLLFKLASPLDAGLPSANFALQTSVNTFSYTFTSAGTASLAFAVVDVNDYSVTSALLVDNVALAGASPVPEPSTYGALAAAALVVMAGVRRVRKPRANVNS